MREIKVECSLKSNNSRTEKANKSKSISPEKIYECYLAICENKGLYEADFDKNYKIQNYKTLTCYRKGPKVQIKVIQKKNKSFGSKISSNMIPSLQHLKI